MDTSRRLAEGVGSWLRYEYSCNHSMLFSERYMSVPIANILHAVYNQEVHSEFLHPILAPEMTGPGRRPEVDFATIQKYPTPSCVLESKWVGARGLTMEEVVWDLLRLELITHHTGADAFFLLAGRRRHLESFFKSRTFLGEEKDGKHRKLLRIDDNYKGKIRVDNPSPDRIKLFKKLFYTHQNVAFSSRLATSLPYFSPKDCQSSQYQVYVWRVLRLPDRSRFKPRDHVLYKV